MRLVTLAWVAVFGVLVSAGGAAQDVRGDAEGVQGVRFLQATGSTLIPLDVRRQPVLARRISVHLEDVTLKEALDEISRRSGVALMYSKEMLPLEHRVYLSAEHITVAGALSEVLFDANVDVVLSSHNQAVLVKRAYRRGLSADSNGTISGHITDAKTHEPIAGVTVQLAPTHLAVLTGADGAYHILNVPPGTYVLDARRIGYEEIRQRLIVAANATVAADIALQARATMLAGTVTTGTVVATQVKALPTPVTVIDQDDIARRHAQTVNDIFRQAVPTGVSFQQPNSPVATYFSVRGASTLAGGGQMKIFIDGVEAAGLNTIPVDPNSIERIEVVRGPEAATLYGADAAGGVIQIFTKRGTANLERPTIDARAQVGIVQTPYQGTRNVLRQAYSANVQGGTPDMTYNFGAGYSRLGDWLPNGEISAQSTPSAYGGMHYTRGILSADVSARYLVNNVASDLNPLLQATGYAFYSKPFYRPQKWTNQTIGGRLVAVARSWWRNELTFGLDERQLDQYQERPRETTPADTLLSVGMSSSQKWSVGYTAILNAAITDAVSGSVVLGVDHYGYPSTSTSTSSALNVDGTIRVVSGAPFSVSRTTITNTGYFAQTQIGVRDVFFATIGLRAENNSTFGSALGTPLLPRFGASLVKDLGSATLKLRGSYGKAIRAPQPGATFGAETPTQINLANPLLAPERQQGWDGGVDVEFGAHGSLSATWFDQTAKDLILFVQVGTTPKPTFQFQNVGRVSNRGLELEATVSAGSIHASAQYGYVRSRIQDLGQFHGNLAVGDRPLGIPAQTAGASIAWTPRGGTALTAGITYLGRYSQTDVIAQYRCLGRTGPCQSSARDYNVDFPGFAKVNASISQRIAAHVSGFASADNLTNKQAYEGFASLPVMGRTVLVGIQLEY